MLLFLNHQSLYCQVKKYWNISLNMTTLQWTSKHSLYHLDFYFCCLFWRPTPAPSLTGITSHKPGAAQWKWIKMAFVNGTKNVILMSDQWSLFDDYLKLFEIWLKLIGHKLAFAQMKHYWLFSSVWNKFMCRINFEKFFFWKWRKNV